MSDALKTTWKGPIMPVEERETETLERAGIRLIKQFESFEPKAYPDPLHGWDVPTIGYGTTVYRSGERVRRGDTITEPEAEAELHHWVKEKIHPKLRSIPHFKKMHPLMVGALESFAYNLGVGFYGGNDFTTISKKLKDKDWATMRAAFQLYVNPGSNVEHGLRRRRNAEASLWELGLKEMGNESPESVDEEEWDTARLVRLVVGFRPENPSHVASLELLAKMLPESAFSEDADWVKAFRTPAAPPTRAERDEGFVLPVDYYRQGDSEVIHNGRRQGPRMCFSSCNAMLLNFLKPGIIHGPNGDDEYLARVLSFGDTTEAPAQLRALNSFGISAEFRQNLKWADVDKQLNKGIPVPIGILHHGPVTAPSGGGHWIIVIGKTSDGKAYWVHDPAGDLDLVRGFHTGGSGEKLSYSKKNTGPRWMVEGDGTGWGIIAQR